MLVPCGCATEHEAIHGSVNGDAVRLGIPSPSGPARLSLFSVSGRLIWQRTIAVGQAVECEAPGVGVCFLEVTWQRKREIVKVVCIGN